MYKRQGLRGGDLDAEELPTDEHVVAVLELLLVLHAHERAVSARRIAQGVAPVALLDLAVVAAHVEIDGEVQLCLLYTSDAADDLLCVDLGGLRLTKKNK